VLRKDGPIKASGHWGDIYDREYTVEHWMSGWLPARRVFILPAAIRSLAPDTERPSSVTDRVLTSRQIADVQEMAMQTGERVPTFNCSMDVVCASHERLRAERDLLDRAASHLSATLAEYVGIKRERDLLRAALAKLEYEDLSQGCNEEGEDYMTCTRCDVQEWGSVDVHEPGDVRHDGECPYAALAAVDAFDKEG